MCFSHVKLHALSRRKSGHTPKISTYKLFVNHIPTGKVLVTVLESGSRRGDGTSKFPGSKLGDIKAAEGFPELLVGKQSKVLVL